jgi:hypothetical protein
MKAVRTMLSVVAVVCFLSLAQADDAKEVELKGTICCCKCELKKTDKCATAIKVKEKDKDVIYVFDADSNKKYHGKICKEPKEGTVKGTVKKDGEKLILTVTELKFAD